jgi:hypothetical protein
MTAKPRLFLQVAKVRTPAARLAEKRLLLGSCKLLGVYLMAAGPVVGWQHSPGYTQTWQLAACVQLLPA